MCGICGIINFDGSPVDTALLDRLTDGLAHRGPDGRGTYIRGNVGLGHRRLKIIDLSEAAAQPMDSEDESLIVTFNGEIYDFQKHRRSLETKGYRFRSQSDTEVLLKLYQEYGESFLKDLRGMFAFAIYDHRKNIVLLARDRFGKKPIKYFFDGVSFAFASELKALRRLPTCPQQIDEEAVHHYLTLMYVPSPMTGIAGIEKLRAGCLLKIDLTARKIIDKKKYWSLSYDTDRRKSVASWKEEIMALFDESVRLRMIADVPLGAFLSGGIDSAAVVALMSKYSSEPVKTFSIGTPEDSMSELPHAQKVASLLRTDHYPIILKPDIVHLLPELVRTYEEPFADPSTIPTYLVAKEARSAVTVALNGDGGDENFAGYVRYPILKFSLYWARAPKILHHLALKGAHAYHHLAKSTLSYRALRFQMTMHYPWAQRYLQYISFFTEEEKRSLEWPEFSRDFPHTDKWYVEETRQSRARAKQILHQAMSMDIDTYLADDLMPKVDLGTMAHGLEARSPLLDHRLLELTSRLPSHLQVHGFQTKWIFKEILRGILPHETLSKRKTGFRLPLDCWFRTELKSFVSDRLLASDSPLKKLLDPFAVEHFLKEYRASRIDYSDHIWALLWLDEWMRQYGTRHGGEP